MTYSLGDVKILVVEDMQPMLSLTKSILSIMGFKNLIGARSGDEGYEMFCKHNPDIVISDWLMEPEDGLELINKIRKDPASPNPYAPIILMTGYSNRLRVEMARDGGITEFLVKPYTAKDLYNRLVQIIEKPRQFVVSETFFGPDRRRRRDEDYEGPSRRKTDDYIVESSASSEQTPEERKAGEQILKKMREDTSKI